MNIIAFDMGGTSIKAGLFVAEDLREVWQLPALAQASMTQTLTLLEAEVARILAAQGLSSLDGLGLAYAGIADSLHNRVIDSNGKYKDAHQVDFVQWARAHFNCALVLENDARLACIGEWQYGLGKGCDNVVVMTLGTGLGTAAVLQGRVLRGKHFQAGVLGGHITLDHHGALCNCGNRGCVEALASSWNLPRIIEQLAGTHNRELASVRADYQHLSFKDIFALARAGVQTAQEVRDYCLEVWGTAAINLVHAYDPEKIIVLGGIVQGDPQYICARLQSKLDAFAWTPQARVIVAAGVHQNSAALWGLKFLLSDPARVQALML